MKKIFKLIIFSVFVSILFPLVSNASTFELRKSKSEKNVVSYDVIIKLDEGDEALKSYLLKLYTSNEDLTYSIVSDYVSDDTSCTVNSCPLIFATEISEVGKENVVATINIINETEVDKETTIAIDDNRESTQKVFTVSALEENTTTTTTTTTKAVANNNLSDLNISVGVMDNTFSKDVLEYNIIEIKDTVNSITLTPSCETECKWQVTCPLGECSVTNPTKNARVSLQTGANKVSIVVTSMDDTINKTYILNVYRGEIESSSAYLSDIKIAGSELSPSFNSMINDYSTTVGLDIDSLDITTIAEDPQANVVVKGNENFQEGENTVTITVTSSDNENKQVYTIIVTKEQQEEEDKEEVDEVVPVTKVEKKKNNLWLIIGISAVALIIIIIVAILLFRKKKNKNNDKNNKSGGMKVKTYENSASSLFEENSIEKENTESLNILDETRRQLKEESKQDIDEALDDLMMTKRLELGDLGL